MAVESPTKSTSILPFPFTQNTLDARSKVQSTTKNTLERPFFGDDIIGALVSNYPIELLEYGFTIEQFLTLDSKDKENYKVLLTCIFEVMVRLLDSEVGEVLEYTPGENRMVINGNDRQSHMLFVRLETKEVANKSTTDILTDIVIYRKTKKKQKEVLRISKGELIKGETHF